MISRIGEIPNVTIAIANSRKPKMPSGSKVPIIDDIFLTQKSILSFLKSLDSFNIYDLDSFAIDISQFQVLRKTIERIVEDITTNKEVDENNIKFLNDIALKCTWQKRLTTNFKLVENPKLEDLIGLLASICIKELSKCDLTRIKRCERKNCELFFYDITRNKSARWHSEDPCGWRSRSERRNKNNQ